MLARLALRICTVEALRAAEIEGVSVLDSQMSALDFDESGNMLTDQEKPFVSVYSETSTLEDIREVRSLHRSGATELVIEAGISASMTQLDPETGETRIVGGIPATDEAMEFFLDTVGRRVVIALTDPGEPWAELWRGLSMKLISIERKRTANANDGARIAAHQTVIALDLLPDPVFGEPVETGSLWQRLLDHMDAAEHPYAATMRALCGASTGTQRHEALQRRRGLTLAEARALLTTPPAAIEEIDRDIARVEMAAP